jgi:Zn-finger nucleic acid-binding protein
MTAQNQNHHYKCPHCACIFLTQADLEKHTAAFGAVKEQHEYSYKKTHGRLEHGYSDE